MIWKNSNLKSRLDRRGANDSSQVPENCLLFGSRPVTNVLTTKLLERDRHKDEFLASLAHELRNPLAPIKHALDSMGLMELTPEVESLRSMMNRHVDQLVHLIDDLQDASRINCGKFVVNKEVTPLRAIIENAVEASSTFIAESGQILTVPALSDDDFVFADPSKLIQVFTNLLNNSAKFSPSGCHIALTIDHEPGFVTIGVRDDGIGIAVEQLQKIFDLYVQVGCSSLCVRRGLGIGLTLVKTLVELHGGTVIAESEGLGKGSRFIVRLPTVDKPFADETALQDSNKIDAKPSRSMRILVVEDLRALRVIMTRLLEKLGHTVEATENGALAIEKLDSFTPEIIFSDISMPGMSGHELARKLRQRSDMKAVYLVAMTGSGTAVDRRLAIKSGFDEHLRKPIDIRQLRNLIDGLPAPTS